MGLGCLGEAEGRRLHPFPGKVVVLEQESIRRCSVFWRHLGPVMRESKEGQEQQRVDFAARFEKSNLLLWILQLPRSNCPPNHARDTRSSGPSYREALLSQVPPGKGKPKCV